jgi:hypothetical protein
MNPQAHKIVAALDAMKGGDEFSATIAPSHQVPMLAALLVMLAEDVDKQTKRIIRLTWALLILTAALLFFTIVLYQDAHQHTYSDTFKQDGSPKTP